MEYDKHFLHVDASQFSCFRRFLCFEFAITVINKKLYPIFGHQEFWFASYSNQWVEPLPSEAFLLIHATSIFSYIILPFINLQGNQWPSPYQGTLVAGANIFIFHSHLKYLWLGVRIGEAAKNAIFRPRGAITNKYNYIRLHSLIKNGNTVDKSNL